MKYLLFFSIVFISLLCYSFQKPQKTIICAWGAREVNYGMWDVETNSNKKFTNRQELLSFAYAKEYRLVSAYSKNFSGMITCDEIFLLEK